MIVSLIVEPRSGSINLANSFRNDKDFTVLFLPSNPKSKWYINDTPKKYKYLTKHLMVKEDFYLGMDFKELLEISEKIIFLYRENGEEQTKSWINARITNNWGGHWRYNDKNMSNQIFEIESFKKMKLAFNEYTKKISNGLKISYEEIYERNGFYKIRNYLGHDITQNIIFPIGERYRLNIKKDSLI